MQLTQRRNYRGWWLRYMKFEHVFQKKRALDGSVGCNNSYLYPNDLRQMGKFVYIESLSIIHGGNFSLIRLE